jgi:hypothetical protein
VKKAAVVKNEITDLKDPEAAFGPARVDQGLPTEEDAWSRK